MRKATDGERELAVLNWGFVLLQKDRPNWRKICERQPSNGSL